MKQRMGILLLLLLNFSLEAVEFVLFTQPKTATHLLIPILTELSGKKPYWAPEFTKDFKPRQTPLAEVLNNPDLFMYSVVKEPWSRQKMDRLWNKNEKQGTFLHVHFPHTPALDAFLAEKKCINFFIKRDPRDQIVSRLNHYKNIECLDKAVKELPDDDAKLTYMIQKAEIEQLLLFMNWQLSERCCVLEFDTLMGAHGGVATDDEALEQMRKIANALELQRTDSDLMGIYQRSFGHGWSFFKGKPGAWRDYFTEAHKALFKEKYGDLLIRYGYEKDCNW